MPADLEERRELEAADEKIMQFQKTMERAASSGALNPEELHRFALTIKEAAARVNDEVLPRIDAESAKKISTRLIAILTLDTDAHDVLDAADQYLVDLEAIRHVFRDLLQEQQPPALRREGRELLATLEEWLPDVQVSQLAEILGLSTRQLQRKRHDEAPAGSREQLVARLVAILRQAWTAEGVVAWFHRPRRDLGGKKPIELLGDARYEPDIIRAARSGRVQGGV